MLSCESCDEPVSAQFARVFGDDNDDVHACLSCSTGRELQRGAGASPTGPTVRAGIALPNES